MNIYFEPCFYGIDFDVIPCYIELPWCHHFDGIIKIKDIDFDNILLHDRPYEKIRLWYFLQNLDWCKTIRIMFDKVDRLIRVYNGATFWGVLDPEIYEAIYDRMRFLIGRKSSITCVISYNYAIIKIDLYDSFL